MDRPHRFRNKHGFTLVEIMLVILIIALIVAIALPNFLRARESAQTRSCLANLTQIEQAKDRVAADKSHPLGYAVTWDEICPSYLKFKPTCPAGSEYTINPIGTDATCPVEEHVLP